MNEPLATIDGRAVRADGARTILDAAREIGVPIPTLCFDPARPPEGGCRLCLVETGTGRVEAACHTPLRAGAAIRTATERVRELRRGILDLWVRAHPPGTFRPAPDGTEFERLLFEHGVAAGGAAAGPARGEGVDESHPFLRFARDRCILCRRCVAACEDVPGRFVYGVEGRGAESRLVFGPTERFRDSPCVACGACVDVCPTGAVSDRDRRGTPPPERTVATVCGYCGVGCRMEVGVAGGRVVRIDGAAGEPNRGRLCVKGRYAHAWHASPDRLVAPLRRGPNGEFEEISWAEATRWVARRLREIRDRHGPGSLGALTSSRSTNEAAYLLQKLFRTALGTNNVDCCARVCHSSTALALSIATGAGAASASFADVERARLIVVAGANPTEAHPVVGNRIRQAALRGTPLVVIDPRRTELAAHAAVHLALRPGTNVVLFAALAKELIESGLVDREYVGARTEGFAELAAFAASVNMEEAAATTGVPAERIREAARRIGEGPALFVSGLGLSELVQGTASVLWLANLAMLTGSIGRPGAGMLPLRGQNNVQGNADMGGSPDRVPGYGRVDDSAVRRRLEGLWGKAPPKDPGLTIPEMMEAAVRGELRALWIQGEDPAQSDPHQTRVLAALGNLELLVVQEMFLTETARRAHLVLPAAGFLEQEGTFTNGERRIQRIVPVVPPPGGARPDHEVILDVARELGESWDYAGPAAVFDEIAKAAPALFGGVSFARLGAEGLQWPCPTPEHAGTATVHAGEFLSGKGLFTAVPYRASPEEAGREFPYILVTGRILEHYNVGTMTRRTPGLSLVPEDLLEIHPDDAAREGIADGDEVEVESEWGATRVRAKLSSRTLPGTLFLTFHFPESHTNRLVGPHVDPNSRCPEYKLTAVRLGPVRA